ncbi:SGNH/GDSL hydrolase family protein [Pseudarthrobacter enclensis]|jgi:lysophospholipase L1-like esterase|uniref:SGNH/GDSL hydrolase family protein n=1 Tax=Pseudarthrobacter enclensis TaxID=993070 RepID=UPI00341529F7
MLFRPPLRRHAGQLVAAGSAALLLALPAGSAAHAPLANAVPPVRVVVVGDSLSTGHGTSPQQAWPALLGTDPAGAGLAVLNAARNGSGYVRPGDDDGTFGTQVEDYVTPDTGIVVFFGSENDLGYPADDIGGAALAAMHRAGELAPAARIIVVGPPSYLPTPDPALAEINGRLREAAAEAGGEYVDPIAEGWISGDVADLIGPDQDHPTVAGQHYLLEHIGSHLGPAVRS